MKIEIPKVIVPVDFGGYAVELQGKFLMVWVNPPLKTLQAYTDLVASLQSRELEEARQVFEAQPPVAIRTPLQKAFDQASSLLRIKKTDKSAGTNQELLEWFARMWSQAADVETHWSADELHTLEQLDPTLLSWMITQTWKARNEHMEQKKKA